MSDPTSPQSGGRDSEDPRAAASDGSGGDEADGGGVVAWVSETLSMPVRAVAEAMTIFRYADFRWVWMGTMLSTMGTWIQNAAKGWLVFELMKTERWLGYDSLATWIPLLVMLPLGGALADRVSRRKLMIAMNLVQAGAALVVGVLIWRGAVTIWHLLGLSLVIGATQGVLIPASQSMLPSLVPREQVRRVVALNAVQFNVARSLGPAVSGWVVVQAGTAWCYIANAASYLCVIVPLLRLPAGAGVTPPHRGGGVLDSLAESWSYLRSRRDLVIVETIVFFSACSCAPVMTLVPALTGRVFGGGAGEYANLLSAMGIGALCAAVLNAVQARRFASVGELLPRIFLLGMIQFGLGVAANYAVAWGLMLASGLVMVGMGNLLQATVISSVPSRLHGRIAGLHVFCFSIGIPVGSAIASFAAERIGIDRAFRAAGLLLCFGVAGLIWAFRHQKIHVDHGTVIATGETPSEKPT